MSDLVEKVCPYVLRGSGAKREILSFRHPLVGWQLVKGTREPGESVEEGALRELVEEAGVVGFLAEGPHWVSATGIGSFSVALAETKDHCVIR